MKSIAVGLLLALALVINPVHGQGDPGPENPTIWAHQTNDPDCCSEWMSTLMDDPAQTLDTSTTLLGVPDNPARSAVSWTLELAPELGSTVELDGAGTVDFIAYIGGGLSIISGVPPLPSGGMVTVTSVLTLGDQVVAEGEPQDVSWTGEWVELQWSVQPAMTTLGAGNGNLVWTITADGATPAISFSTGEENGRTRLTLPTTIRDEAVGPEDHFADLTAATASVSHSFTNATSDTYHYNWTSDLGGVNVTYDAAIQNGSALLSVVDGAGTTLLESNLTSDFGETQPFPDAADGNWTITIAYTDFVGDFSVALEPYQAPAAVEDGPDSNPDDGAPSGDDNGTPEDQPVEQPTGDNSTNSPDEESPGVGLLAIPLLLGVAIARRRK